MAREVQRSGSKLTIEPKFQLQCKIASQLTFHPDFQQGIKFTSMPLSPLHSTVPHRWSERIVIAIALLHCWCYAISALCLLYAIRFCFFCSYAYGAKCATGETGKGWNNKIRHSRKWHGMEIVREWEGDGEQVIMGIICIIKMCILSR